MLKMEEIHNFAVKWLDKFRDQNINYLELIDHNFCAECNALGFKTDLGNMFIEKYGDAFCNYEVLNNIIDEVNDIQLLGSAIYSRIDYFSNLEEKERISEPQNRTWFILSLGRLVVLTGDNPFIFYGTLKQISIVSNNVCQQYTSLSDNNIEQHLVIKDDGSVSFTSYDIDGNPIYKQCQDNFKISKERVDELFSAFTSYFSDGYDVILATDVGTWNMELTNTNGIAYRFGGSLGSHFEYNGKDLSDLIRETVGMDDLLVFDGNYILNFITKIVLDYHRQTIVEKEGLPEQDEIASFTWDYSEHLIIDRKTKTLEHIQNIGSDCKVTHKYEIEGGIESLLDDFDPQELFSNINGNPSDVIETPNETKDYKITIDSNNMPKRIIEGSFDKNGLPDDFNEFIEAIFDFINFYGIGEIFDPSIYGKAKRRKSDYIFLSVTFLESYKNYYYLTDDDSIKVGDHVVVPVGENNYKEIAEVVNVEYFDEKNAPFPIERTKEIIRKCTQDEIDSIDE